MTATAPPTFGRARYVPLTTAARVLGLPERTLRHYASEGDVPARRVGARWVLPAWWVRGEPEPRGGI